MSVRRLRRDEWGPLAWDLIHTMAAIADRTPEIDNARVICPKVLARFWMFLPCNECREHYRELVLKSPPPRRDFYFYTVALHNRVNEMLGKPLFEIGGIPEVKEVNIRFINYLYDMRVIPVAAECWVNLRVYKRALVLMLAK